MEVRTKEVHVLLSPLSDKKLFAEISQGLQNIHANANSFFIDAKTLLEQDRICGHNILFSLAEEEAGKFLLLLDAIRCPKGNLSGHLRRFDKHIPKGIYAISSYWQVSSFAEVKKYINDYLRQKALISLEPEGAWISKNSITTQRELSIYVDYIVTYTGKTIWTNPSESKGTPPVPIPEALELANAFLISGFTKPESLEVISNIWKPIQMTDGFRWESLQEINLKTLNSLAERNLLEQQSDNVYQKIIKNWSFPMHSIELDIVLNKPSDLKEELEKINSFLED